MNKKSFNIDVPKLIPDLWTFLALLGWQNCITSTLKNKNNFWGISRFVGPHSTYTVKRLVYLANSQFSILTVFIDLLKIGMFNKKIVLKLKKKSVYGWSIFCPTTRSEKKNTTKLAI